jgi:hypothetical protein
MPGRDKQVLAGVPRTGSLGRGDGQAMPSAAQAAVARLTG